jgi:predicted nucleic acid-binding protein
MSEPFVADSSIGIGWVHASQSTELTKRLLEEAKLGTAIYVPALWHLEVANALLVAVRRKLLTESQRQLALTLLSQLRVIVDDETSRLAFSAISELAAKHSLSVHDAAYLELARRKSLSLGSRDAALCSAAKSAGIRLFQ